MDTIEYVALAFQRIRGSSGGPAAGEFCWSGSPFSASTTSLCGSTAAAREEIPKIFRCMCLFDQEVKTLFSPVEKQQKLFF